MRTVWRLAVQDLRRTARDRVSLVWLLLMPVVFMWMFGQMGGGRSGTPSISLSVLDRDDGWLSAALLEELDDDSVDLHVLTPDEVAAGTEKIRTLVIPEGFTRGAMAGEQQTLRLEKEPGTNEEFGLAAQVLVVRAIVRLVGRLAETGNPGDGEAALERMRELAARPRLVTLAVETAGQGTPVPSGRAQSVPGTITFTVMMMTLIYGAVWLTGEKESGTLRRLASLPLGRRHVFLGKLGGRLLLAAAQIAILVAVGRFLFGIDWGRSVPALVLLLAAYALAVGALSTMLGALLRTPAQASSVGWILGMVLAALGGCWWPGELMPDWMIHVAHGVPTAWAMDGFHALISYGRGLDGVAVPALALIGFGLVFSLIGARFLRYD